MSMAAQHKSPARTFLAVWISILLLYSVIDARWMPYPDGMHIAYFSLFFFCFGWGAILYNLFPRSAAVEKKVTVRQQIVAYFSSQQANRRLLVGLVVFGTVFLAEIAAAGGLPLLSFMGIGAEINYTDFGLPGVHGILNSLYYAIFLLVIVNKRMRPWKRRILLISLICYPVAIVSRQVLMSAMIQATLMAYLSSTRPFRFIMRGVLGFVALIFLLGWLGDQRSGADVIRELSGLDDAVSERVPTAALWLMTYILSPIANVFNNAPSWDGNDLYPFLSGLLPTVFQGIIDATRGELQIDLVDPRLNAGSIFIHISPFLGYAGVTVLGAVLGFALEGCRLGKWVAPGSFKPFIYVIAMHGVVLSMFDNLLVHIVFVVEYLFIRLIVGRAPRRSAAGALPASAARAPSRA